MFSEVGAMRSFASPAGVRALGGGSAVSTVSTAVVGGCNPSDGGSATATGAPSPIFPSKSSLGGRGPFILGLRNFGIGQYSLETACRHAVSVSLFQNPKRRCGQCKAGAPPNS